MSDPFYYWIWRHEETFQIVRRVPVQVLSALKYYDGTRRMKLLILDGVPGHDVVEDDPILEEMTPLEVLAWMALP